MLDVLEGYVPMVALGQLVLDSYSHKQVFPIEIFAFVLAIFNYMLPSDQIGEYFFKTEDVVEFARYSENIKLFNRNFVTKNPMLNDLEDEPEDEDEEINEEMKLR